LRLGTINMKTPFHFAIFIAMFFTSIGSTIVIHEVAHLLAAITVGWQIKGMKLGPISISGRDFHLERQWLSGALLLEPVDRGLARFAKELRIVVGAGPAANVLVGLLTLASSSFLMEIFGCVQLVIGVRNLIPSTDRNAPWGNDGNILFRVSKDNKRLEELYFDLIESPNIVSSDQ
jgi:hypothetical protein